jgi:hypothetical protein
VLKQTPARVISALASLEGNSEFEALRSYLQECLDDLRNESATTKDEVILRWQQGGTQVLTELLDRAARARELTYKLQKNRS